MHVKHTKTSMPGTYGNALAQLKKKQMTPAGLEPAIPGSVGRCLIHWATGPDACRAVREGESTAACRHR